jgi:uncharacterized membrane protein AbrB (regulator of aidB expression)
MRTGPPPIHLIYSPLTEGGKRRLSLLAVASPFVAVLAWSLAERAPWLLGAESVTSFVCSLIGFSVPVAAIVRLRRHPRLRGDAFAAVGMGLGGVFFAFAALHLYNRLWTGL